jgi:hypothetical protein
MSPTEEECAKEFFGLSNEEKIRRLEEFFGIRKGKALSEKEREWNKKILGDLPEEFDWENVHLWSVDHWAKLIRKSEFISRRLGLRQEYYRRILVLEGVSESASYRILRPTPYSYALKNAELSAIANELNDIQKTGRDTLCKRTLTCPVPGGGNE